MVRWLVIASLILAGCAGNPSMRQADQAIRLKDDSILYIDSRGLMRMRDGAGHKLFMADGEAMETADGRVIAMKEDPIWRQLRIRGTLVPK